MVATTAFVLGFVLLGLTVVFLAMRGGPRGARSSLHGGRGHAVAAIMLAAVLIGIGLPTVLTVGNSKARKDNGPGGSTLTAAQIKGRELFARNCATCHTLKGAGATGRVGPNLDELRPPKALVLNAIQLGRAQGRGQMPALLLTGPEARDVSDFVAAVAGR